MLETGTANIDSLLSKAESYLQQYPKDDAKAIATFKEALALSRSQNGSVHATTSKILRHISTCYNNLKDYQNALPFLKENVSCLKSLHGENNRNYIIELNDYALNYYRLKRYNDAIPLYRKAIEMDDKYFANSHHLDRKTFHSNLILCYEALGEYNKTIPLQKRVTKVLTTLKGAKHEETLESRSQELYFLCKLKRYGEAVPLYAELVKFTEEVKGLRFLQLSSDTNTHSQQFLFHYRCL